VASHEVVGIVVVFQIEMKISIISVLLIVILCLDSHLIINLSDHAVEIVSSEVDGVMLKVACYFGTCRCE